MICIGYFVLCLSGVCPPLAAKRREPPFDGCVPSNECSASPEWLETLSAPRKEFPHRSASQGSEAGVCPPLAAKRRELQWNSSSAVPSKFSQPGVARGTRLTPVFARLRRPARSASPGSEANPVFVRLRRPNGVNLHLTVASRQMNVQPARSGSGHSPCPGTGNPSLGFPAEKQYTGLFLLPS